MIKILLGLSVACNVFLGYSLMSKKTNTEVVERLIIESHTEAPQADKKAEVLLPQKKEAKSKEVKEDKQKDAPQFIAMESPELQEAAEKMESERVEFLTGNLGFSEEQISKHNKLRDEFYKETSEFWGKNSMRELSFKERRQMLDLEEKLHKNLEKLHGKKNWEKFQKFRETYNQKGFQQQTEENRPFIFMGL